MKRNNMKILIIIAIVITLIAGISGTYSFFVYRKTGQNIDISSGDISIDFVNNSNYINVVDAYPVSDAKGKIYPYYTDFTINSNVLDYSIKYEIQIVPDNSHTIGSEYIKVYLTDLDDNEIVPSTFYNDLANASHNTTGKTFYTDTMTTSGTRSFRLRVWIDESYAKNIKEEFGFNIYLYATNGDAI